MIASACRLRRAPVQPFAIDDRLQKVCLARFQNCQRARGTGIHSRARMLLAMIVAVRRALDYSSTRRAVAVCIFGSVLAIVFAMVVGFFFGPRVS